MDNYILPEEIHNIIFEYCNFPTKLMYYLYLNELNIDYSEKFNKIKLDIIEVLNSTAREILIIQKFLDLDIGYIIRMYVRYRNMNDNKSLNIFDILIECFEYEPTTYDLYNCFNNTVKCDYLINEKLFIHIHNKYNVHYIPYLNKNEHASVNLPILNCDSCPIKRL